MNQKAITFSFDDGVRQDIRLIEILNKYGLKATFNLNSKRLGFENVINANEVRSVYAGHEIAAHTLTHARLTELNDTEIVRQVENDRATLSELTGYEVLGLAYPGGGVNHSPHVANVIRKNTGIKYARVWETNHSFLPQEDLYCFKGTVDIYNEEKLLYKLADDFLSLQTDTPSVFYLWGHAYEFDYRTGSWENFETFCSYISNKQDIFYGTNKDVLLDRQITR